MSETKKSQANQANEAQAVARILKWKKAQHDASRANNAAGVFRCQNQLRRLWAEQDARK